MTTFTVTGDQLFEAASWVSRATPSKATIPVLSGMVLDASVQDRLELRAFDYETSMTARLDATVTEPGRLLVSAALLCAVAKTVNRAVNVTVTCDGSTARVRSGKTDWQLPLLPVDDFPQLPTLGEPVGAVDGEPLRAATTRASSAAGRDATLPALTGLRLESDGDRLTMVGTDRFRLCAADLDWRRKTDEPLGLVVPAALLDGAVRGMGSGEVTVHASSQLFALSTADRSVSGRLIGEQFPRWASLMPGPSATFVEVDGEALVAAAGQAMALAAAKLGTEGALRFEVGGGEVAVSVSGQDGRAHAVCGAETVGEAWTVHASGDYVCDALRGAGSERVRLHYGGGPTRPVLVTAVGDDSYRHLVMPVRPPDGAVQR